MADDAVNGALVIAPEDVCQPGPVLRCIEFADGVVEVHG